MKRIESTWRKDIVKVIGGNTSAASDTVFIEFLRSWLVDPEAELVPPSKMVQNNLEASPRRTLRRYIASRPAVSTCSLRSFAEPDQKVSLLHNP